MNADERRYLDERLSSLTTLVNARFLNLDEKLEMIHEQTLKTNEKVAHHEAQIQEALIERARNREEQRQVKEYVEENCDRVENIEKSLEEYRMAIKYPRLFIVGLAFVIILSILTFIESNKRISKAIGLDPTPTEQVEK